MSRNRFTEAELVRIIGRAGWGLNAPTSETDKATAIAKELLRTTLKTMTCMSCGKTLTYPECFPDPTMATCWDCAWTNHIRNSHPKTIREIRKAVRKRAKNLVAADEERAMFEHEKAVLLGLPKPSLQELLQPPRVGDEAKP